MYVGCYKCCNRGVDALPVAYNCHIGASEVVNRRLGSETAGIPPPQICHACEEPCDVAELGLRCDYVR